MQQGASRGRRAPPRTLQVRPRQYVSEGRRDSRNHAALALGGTRDANSRMRRRPGGGGCIEAKFCNQILVGNLLARSTQSRSSAASDVYKRQAVHIVLVKLPVAILTRQQFRVKYYYSQSSFRTPPVPSVFEDSPCLLYTSPSPRDLSTSRMPSSA